MHALVIPTNKTKAIKQNVVPFHGWSALHVCTCLSPATFHSTTITSQSHLNTHTLYVHSPPGNDMLISSKKATPSVVSLWVTPLASVVIMVSSIIKKVDPFVKKVSPTHCQASDVRKGISKIELSLEKPSLMTG